MGKAAKLKQARAIMAQIEQISQQPGYQTPLTLEQRRASFTISYAMAMIGDLKAKEKPKTALWNRLDQTDDCLGKALDFYRLAKFSNPDLRRASKLHDAVGREICRLVPSTRRKKRARRQQRNSCRIERPVRTAHR